MAEEAFSRVAQTVADIAIATTGHLTCSFTVEQMRSMLDFTTVVTTITTARILDSNHHSQPIRASVSQLMVTDQLFFAISSQVDCLAETENSDSSTIVIYLNGHSLPKHLRTDQLQGFQELVRCYCTVVKCNYSTLLDSLERCYHHQEIPPHPHRLHPCHSLHHSLRPRITTPRLHPLEFTNDSMIIN